MSIASWVQAGQHILPKFPDESDNIFQRIGTVHVLYLFSLTS